VLQLIQSGRLRFAPESEFFFPWEVAVTNVSMQEMAL
jgi:hypothetical protein